MKYRLTPTGWLITVGTLGLAFPIVWMLRPRSRPSPFKLTGEFLSKYSRGDPWIRSQQ